MKNSLKGLVEEAQALLDAIKLDTAKFTEKGNNAAGTRVRTGSMSLIKKLGYVRKTVSEIKKA